MYRLVGHCQFARFERFAQVVLQPEALLGRLGQVTGEEAVAALALLLGLVHRQIAVFQQQLGTVGVVGEHRDADACPHQDRVSADHEGLPELVEQHARGLLAGEARIAPRHQRDEFVAAQPGEHRR